MFVLLAYDVDFSTPDGSKRLRKIAKYCEGYGIRVQNSTFELLVDNGQYEKIKADLSEMIDVKTDSIRFYKLGNSWEQKIEHIGVKAKIEQNEPIIL